jgi:antitoxin component YwqK of YwqJK toxin-antitoxin module
MALAPIPDGRKSFLHPTGPWRAVRYEGNYREGVRDGVWCVTDAETGDPLWEITWSAGEWHGPAKTWHRSGQLEHEGEYSRGEHTGVWTYWFENGQLGASGRYERDRKVGDWKYWDKQGDPMPYEAWEREYDHYDWAYDDYTGMPKGENWPEPPLEGS